VTAGAYEQPVTMPVETPAQVAQFATDTVVAMDLRWMDSPSKERARVDITLALLRNPNVVPGMEVEAVLR